jgi:hypothetical protein
MTNNLNMPVKLISAGEAAIKLKVSPRRVQILCAQGRIRGAQIVGGSWILPTGFRVTPGARGPKMKRKS